MMMNERGQFDTEPVKRQHKFVQDGGAELNIVTQKGNPGAGCLFLSWFCVSGYVPMTLK